MLGDVTASHLANPPAAPVRAASATHPARAAYRIGHHVPSGRELAGRDPARQRRNPPGLSRWGMSVEAIADSMVPMRRYVAPIASVTRRASPDFSEPGARRTPRNRHLRTHGCFKIMK